MGGIAGRGSSEHSLELPSETISSGMRAQEGPEIYSPSQHRMLHGERVELRSGCKDHSILQKAQGAGRARDAGKGQPLETWSIISIWPRKRFRCGGKCLGNL